MGIKFVSSSYAEINELAQDKEQENINQLLDSTFGYYTIDLKNKFVLAHYNWHAFASIEKSNGEYDTTKNLLNCSDTLNRRIERLFTLCDKASYIALVYCNRQKYKYLCIDDEVYSLTDFDIIIDAFKKTFSAEVFFVDLEDEDFLSKIRV